MCFDSDSRPPIPAIAGGALDARDVVLEAADGNRFRAYLARAAEPTGAGILILPDVRGVVALGFAEQGVDGIAIDYFGRTAGIGDRDHGFEYQAHVRQITYAGLRAEIEAAAARLRSEAAVKRLFVTGFIRVHTDDGR
jgi:carboxymethylenebutenolidase